MGFSIVIGGDIVPSFGNLHAFCDGNINGIISEDCYKFLMSADFRIYNLETPISDTEKPIKKEGACFRVPTSAIKGIGLLQPECICLANNHCKDQAEQGLLETVAVLKKAGIKPFGYGKKNEDIVQSVVLEKDGIKVTVIACAETEFSIYSENEYGAIPYHDFWTNDAIKKAKQQSDIVIALYHGGKEYYQYAPPYLRERCHLMVDCGADYVICQHSHCIGCEEQYEGATILYGQGNFIFRQKNNRLLTKEGLLVKIDIQDGIERVEYVPVFLDETDKVCLMQGQMKEETLSQFNERSGLCRDQLLCDEKFSELSQIQAEGYYGRLNGNKTIKLIRKLWRKMGRSTFDEAAQLRLLNLLQNEAHRELFIHALREEIFKK